MPPPLRPKCYPETSNKSNPSLKRTASQPLTSNVRKWELMMKVNSGIVLAISALFLTACATPNTGERVIDAGPQPSEAQAATAVMDYLRTTLKDPDSIKQFRIRSGPETITWYRGLINGGGNEQAWLICFEYNAKNSYGGYVGLKTDGVALRLYGDRASVVPWVNWGLADRRCF